MGHITFVHPFLNIKTLPHSLTLSFMDTMSFVESKCRLVAWTLFFSIPKLNMITPTRHKLQLDFKFKIVSYKETRMLHLNKEIIQLYDTKKNEFVDEE